MCELASANTCTGRIFPGSRLNDKEHGQARKWWRAVLDLHPASLPVW
jgi:hypothetical protein